MTCYSISDKGKKREENQDRYSNYSSDILDLLLLADGMGGHRDGALASSLAVDKAREYIIENEKKEEPELLVKAAIEAANRYVYMSGEDLDGFRRMGTTICLALICGNDLYMGHVGDSRIYLFSDGQLKQLTRDHSVVNDLLEEGLISLKEAMVHPDRHTLTRALGTEKQVEVDLNKAKIKDSDILLLCSDGLSNMVNDENIRDVLAKDLSLEEKALELDRLANENGGLDNITLTLYKIGADDGTDGAK